jgi:hypothetical protein
MIDFLSPLSPAIERTTQQLFRPFDLKKWFLLGFSAWLASFISNSGSGYSTYSPFDHADGERETWSFVLRMGLPTWIAIVLGVGLFVWLLMGVFSWLGCRGKFMFLENVLFDRALVRVPWRNSRQLGNSFFRLYFLLASISYASCIATILFAMVFLWPDLAVGRVYQVSHYIPLILVGALFLLISVSTAISNFFLREFGVLWMYRYNALAGEAARKIADLATQEPIQFILYLLIRLVLVLVFIILVVAVACVACCLNIIPYLGSVIMLPYSVFLTWYNIGCFAQFGPDFDVRLTVERPPELPSTNI